MIKIEVTGNSIPEVADKLLAIGASLRASGTLAEVAKEAPVDPTLNRPTSDASVTSPDTSSDTPRSVARKSAPVVEATDSQPTTAEPSSTPVPVALVSEEPLEVVDLPVDVETDLRALILKVVTKRGKPYMEDILSSFGVVKASHLEAALLPKLIDRCNEALGQ